MSESTVQAHIRIAAAKAGWKLYRNNVGVLTDSRNIPVRFGLANDSKQLNEMIKSGDLIGWRPLVITPDMVGKSVAQFVSIECKRDGWNPGANTRDVAQKRWADMVNKAGGYAIISRGEL